MLNYFKKLTIRNIISPYGLAFVSVCFFLFAWLFPPDLYTQFVQEPDLMFLEPSTIAFYILCVLTFLVGVRISRFFRLSLRNRDHIQVFVRSPLLYLLPPLFIASVLCSIYLVLLGGKINFLALLTSQQGGAIKLAGESGQLSTGRWGVSLMLLTATIWWSMFRMRQLAISKKTKIIFFILVTPCILIDFFTCVATVDRTNLMPLISGIAVIYFYDKIRAENLRVLRLISSFLGIMISVVLFFLLMSFLRGTLGTRLLMMGLLGYTVVSYNRLAALMLGAMHYSYEGRGVYLFRFLLQNENLNNLFHISDRFGWPTAIGVWQTEFSTVMAAGLNPGFNWSSTFGYLYSDLGWYSPIYLFLIGIIAGRTWASFSAGKTIGIVFYPWVSFWILFWFGWNLIFDSRSIWILESGVLLLFYDALFLKKRYKTAVTAYNTNAELRLSLSDDTRGFF
jgi:hypothetical protein